MDRPRFRADYQPIRVGGDTLVVAGEGRHLVLGDAVTGDVADLLDGTLTVSDVVARLADRHPLPAVFQAVRRLQALRVLAEGTTAAPVERAAGWDARGADPDAAEAWTRTGRVRLVDLGAPTVEVLAAVLRATGPAVDIVRAEQVTAAPGDPLVVAPATLLDPALAGFNARMLAAGTSWTLVRPHGNVLALGPHLVPGETGCWECLHQRMAANEQLENFLAAEHPDAARVTTARAALPATAAAVAGLLAAELAVIAATGRSERLTGRLVTLDARDHATATHTLVRQPQCPACGDPDVVLKADPRIVLTPQPRRFAEDGGHRTVTPQETFDRLEHHVSPVLGVVIGISPLDDHDNGVTFSYGAGHNFALGNRSIVSLRKNLRGQSGGKGRTEIQAKVSAVCEAIERYSGVWRGDRPVHSASYAQLGPERALHPRELLLFSDEQYARREELNRHGGSGLHFVPRRLDDDAVLDWSTGWSLTHDRPRELPAAYCWFGHPDLTRLGYSSCDANGCASGNTLEEAILQGFCELAERDAVALWWYNRSLVPGVELDGLGDPWLDRVRDFYDRDLRRSLWVLDVTADLPVPCYVAVSHCLDREVQDPIVGFGAHLDPVVALRRAVTEVNQFLPSLVRRNPDGSTLYGLNDPDSLEWFTTVRVAEQPWLAPAPGPLTTVGVHGDGSTGDIAADVRRCVELTRDAGMEVVVLDQSRPELELPVARVVVPGMRHFWRRLGPGRLYDVPAALGRTPRAAGEAETNPYSVFF